MISTYIGRFINLMYPNMTYYQSTARKFDFSIVCANLNLALCAQIRLILSVFWANFTYCQFSGQILLIVNSLGEIYLLSTKYVKLKLIINYLRKSDL